MEHDNGSAYSENLLSIAQYTIELFRPGHKFATVSLEEVISALRHDIKTRSSRLKCISVPLSVHRTLIPSSVYENEIVFDYDSCAIVGSQAAIALGIPVGGSCWVLLSNCECPINGKAEHEFVCRLPKHPVKDYAVQVVANRHLPPYEIILNEELYHNVSKFLYGSKSTIKNNLVVSARRCENSIRRCVGNNGLKFLPQMAVRAVVSCIDVPNLEENETITTCLCNYFGTPRHLHRGDIFKINLKENAPDAVFSYKNQNSNLYFVVQKLEGPPYKNVKNADKSIGYIIGQGITTLLQDKHVQSFIPSSKIADTSKAVPSRQYKELLIPRCPPAFSNVHDDLILCIQLFLSDAPAGLKPTFLLTGPVGSGKYSLITTVAAHLGLHTWAVDCSDIQGTTPGQTEGKLRSIFSKAKQHAPCLFILSNIDIICNDQDGQEDFRTIEEFQEQVASLSQCNFPVIVIATCSLPNSISSSMSRMFLQEFSIPSLGKNECESLLPWLMSQYQVFSSQTCIENVASRCAGFLFADLKELVTQALRNHFEIHSDTQDNGKYSGISHELSLVDFETALDKMQSAYAGAIGAPKVPSVKWSDVGGLGNVKEEILRTITMPLKHPELIAAGLRRSGILLYGPPGTGKTLIAKAVATECNLNFLSVKGPELLNMYVGQSEANVREVFERAREASPCIIFFDELDSLAPSRGRSGDSGGVMDRVVSQLLAEMDGLQKSSLLFVIGATNRPDLVDPALLRPGRFDKLMYIGACEDKDSQLSVLKALIRKFNLSPDVDLSLLVQDMPNRVTGADMYAVCSDAWMGAVRRLIKSSEIAGNGNIPSSVEVSFADFKEAIGGMVSSVSAEDMLYFKSLQKELSPKK